MRNKILPVILLLSISTNIFGQKSVADSSLLVKQKIIPSKIFVDSVRIQNIEPEEFNTAWYKDNNMPWIIALIISMVGILINLLIANKQIRANLKQINANNRQTWVTETRNVIAELTTQANLLNIEFQETDINIERKKNLHEKFTYNKNKLFLLLKPEKEKHKSLFNSLNALMLTLDEHMLNSKANINNDLNIPFDNGKFMTQTDKVIESGRNLLYDEWGKIQSLK